MREDQRGESRWFHLTLPAPPRHEGYLLVDALHRLGARSVQARGDSVVAVLPADRPAEERLPELRAALRSSTSVPVEALSWRPGLPPGFGETLRGAIRPVQVSPRLRVVPVSEGRAGDPRADATRTRSSRSPSIVLRLEPSLAFGSPSHPTTRRCLAILDPTVSPGDRWVDVGSGSGILAIAAARLGADGVIAFEMDASACEVARRNAVLNGVADRMDVREGLVRPATLDALPAPDGVVANLPPDALFPLLPALARLPRPGGSLVLSGVPRADADALGDALAAGGIRLASTWIDDGWWSGVGRRPPDADRVRPRGGAARGTPGQPSSS